MPRPSRSAVKRIKEVGNKAVGNKTVGAHFDSESAVGKHLVGSTCAGFGAGVHSSANISVSAPLIGNVSIEICQTQVNHRLP